MRGIEIVNGQAVRCYELPEQQNNAERWTILYVDQPIRSNSNPGFHCLTPAGRSTCKPGKHLGKRVQFDSLPEPLRIAVENDLCSAEVTR